MYTLKCILQYDGSNFSGFQRQPRGRTIQGETERALKKMHKGESVHIHASGRTDKGVHAIGQTIHFQTPYQLAPRNWKRALNTLLPDDLYIMEVEQVPQTFHSRYDALEKVYRYKVYLSKEYDVFRQHYAYHFPYPLDMEKVHQACTYLQGRHDFTTFSSAKDTSKGSKFRTLSEVSCRVEGEELIFTFRGDGYLYHMVRIMVGTLLNIGQGKGEAKDIPNLFAARDRRLAGETAPAHGLYLWEVTYKMIE